MATVRPETWIPDARGEPSLRSGIAFGRILTAVLKAFAINDREVHKGVRLAGWFSGGIPPTLSAKMKGGKGWTRT